jgi:hypothetical protein
MTWSSLLGSPMLRRTRVSPDTSLVVTGSMRRTVSSGFSISRKSSRASSVTVIMLPPPFTRPTRRESPLRASDYGLDRAVSRVRLTSPPCSVQACTGTVVSR